MWKTMWGKAIGTVLGFFMIASITGFWYHLSNFWEVQAAVIALESEGQSSKENQEEIIGLMKGLAKQMGDVITKQEYFEKLLVTPEIGGRATIGTFGRDASYVEINEDGKANMYLTVDRISLTYKDGDGISHTVELLVRGSFVNRDDNGHLLMLSAKAGRDLGMNGITRQIIVGPGSE